MTTLVLPHITRTTLRVLTVLGTATALVLGGTTISQAADSPGVTSTQPKAPSDFGYSSFAGFVLTPDQLYTSAYDADPWPGSGAASWLSLSSNPVLGKPKTLLSPDRGTTVIFASAGRALIVSDTSTFQFDRGTQTGSMLGDSTSALSGSWYVQRATGFNNMTSLDGATVDLSQYESSFSTETPAGWVYNWTTATGIFGSLVFYHTSESTPVLMPDGSVTYTASNSGTVRDASKGGTVVGNSFTLPLPTGADDSVYPSCTLTGGEVDCLWTTYDRTTGNRIQAMWVTRTDYLSGKTTTISLTLPPDLAQAQSSICEDYNGWADGVLGLTCSAILADGSTANELYAYNLNQPSQYVHIDGDEIASALGNRLAVVTNSTAQNPVGSVRVVGLPFGGGSKPYLIGVVGDQNTVAPGAPLNLELDLSKPVQAGTLTITGPGGTPIATLKTPASTDGSLRGLTWTPPITAPSGTYTWTLNVTDNTGQAAVNNIGNGAPSGTFTVKNCTPFTDVPATYQFASSICWASANGITKGTGDGTTYSPANPVNRGSMAAFLYRLAGSPTWKPPTTSPFVDVTPTNQFYSAITWLAATGITKGTLINGQLYYQPTNAVNRGSMAAFMYRIAGNPTWTAPTTPPFPDITGNQFYTSITWLAANGITTGSQVNGVTMYVPGNTVNRGSMAAFMSRLATKHLIACTPYPHALGCTP